MAIRRLSTEVSPHLITKQQEIDYLYEIADVPAGTYLASFFTPEMKAHLVLQIHQDVCTDVYGDLLFNRSAREKAESELTNVQWKFEAYQESRNTELARVNDYATKQITELKDKIDHVKSLEASSREWANQNAEEREAVQIDLDRANARIAKLERAMFRLMEQGADVPAATKSVE